MKNQNEMVLDGFEFSSRNEFERALKEKETIEYIVAHTNMSDMKNVLKVYNKAVEKKSFQTVIGLEFVNNMRKRLVSSGTVKEENLAYVPVTIKYTKQKSISVLDKDETTRKAEKYKSAYEAEVAGKKIRNMAIVFLTVILIVLVIITVKSKYSVFTYFTNYKSNMENELIDKYENWEKTLEERQKVLDEREQEIEKKEKSSVSDEK